MKKILHLGCICFILSTSLFSGCVNIPKELTQMSIYTFSVVPTIITEGQTANLSWSVIGATTVSIDQSIGSVSLIGTRIITPTQSTIYTLTASNTTRTITATVQILVYPYSPPQQTPNIACTTDSTTNRITVATADANINWRDIVITLDKTGATYRVYYANGTAICAVNNTAAAGTAQVSAGDYIRLSTSWGNVKATLKYMPTNSLLGSWTINV